MGTRDELSELLDKARKRASYNGSNTDSAIIMDLVIELERMLTPTLERTLDDVYEQGEKILAVAAGNQGILRSVAEEYHRALEEEQQVAGHPVNLNLDESEEEADPTVPAPPTHVEVHLTDNVGHEIVVGQVDTVQIFDHGSIVAAFQEDESGNRHIGYYDNEGEFHRFDTRLSRRPGW